MQSAAARDTTHPRPEPDKLPLWLSKEEAELLVSLCLTSRHHLGEAEHQLFAKLGDLLRDFRR